MRLTRLGRWLDHPLTLCVLAGALYALAFPPVHAGPLAWLALFPFVRAMRSLRTWRQAVLYGALAAVVMCAIGYAWIADMAMRFWRAPLPVAALLLLVYASFGEINFTLFALILQRWRGRFERWPAAATALLYTLLEEVVPKVFPDTLGSTQGNMPFLPASAALVGTFGLSFLLAWFGACLGWWGGSGGVSRRRRAMELGLCLLCVALLWTYGLRRQRLMAALPVERQLRLALVQTNIGDAGVFIEELGSSGRMASHVIGRYAAMTQATVKEQRADLVVWPETAVPVTPRNEAFEPVRALVRSLDVPLVFGGYDFQVQRTGTWRVYNTLFWMDSRGRVRERYHKHNLLPLGEHIPFAERFPVLLDLIPNAGEFSPGPGARVLEVEGVRYAPLICYELLFPRYVRRGVRLGAEVLLNLTNDYWFGSYGEPEQHLSLARVRAFETGRPIVRATNTGISAVIDADGSILARTALWQPEVLRATLPLHTATVTPYVRAGEWVVVALAGFAWGLAALLWKFVP